MRKVLVIVGVVALVSGACGKKAAGPGPERNTNPCANPSSSLVNPPKLTIATDNPAFPPWFAGGTPKGSEWKFNDPSTGKGYESAVAYAVAAQLGFHKDDVVWIPEPFGKSFAPGPKDFDFDINQISFKPARAKAVDFSKSYYDVNQALIAIKGTPIANATSLAALKPFKLGAPVGTTSFDYIQSNIQPTQKPSVFDTLNDVNSALKAGQIDGEVVDLPTAFFITGAGEVKNSVVVGQFPSIGGQEHFGMVFQKGDPLVQCVNFALDSLKAKGTLEQLQKQWLSQAVGAPVLR